MKKGLLLCMLFLMVSSLATLSSCSKDDDKPKEEDVFGHPFLEGTKWRYGSKGFYKEIEFLPSGIMSWDTHFGTSHIMYFKYTFDLIKKTGYTYPDSWEKPQPGNELSTFTIENGKLIFGLEYEKVR